MKIFEVLANLEEETLLEAEGATGGDEGKRAHWLLNMCKGNRKRK